MSEVKPSKWPCWKEEVTLLPGCGQQSTGEVRRLLLGRLLGTDLNLHSAILGASCSGIVAGNGLAFAHTDDVNDIGRNIRHGIQHFLGPMHTHAIGDDGKV